MPYLPDLEVSTAIDDYIPRWDVRERHRTTVSASPERVYSAIRGADMGRSPIISLLFRLRELPAALKRKPRRRPRLNLDGLLEAGFMILEEREGEEILLGLVGRFWSPAANVRRSTPGQFRAFDLPGHAYAAWNFRVRSGAGVVLSTETRVRCTSRRSRTLFRVYWTLVGPFSGLIRREMLRLIKLDAEALETAANV